MGEFREPKKEEDMKYNVILTWDEEANMWVATTDDIPGLVLESNSYEVLIEKVKIASPELLELNNVWKANYQGRVKEYEV